MSIRDTVDPNEVLSNAGQGETFATVIERRLSRRSLLKGAAAISVATLATPVLGQAIEARAKPKIAPSLSFESIEPSTADSLSVAKGHRATVLLRWGDPILADAPPFDPLNHTAEAQAKQFGHNCDYVGFMPLPLGSTNSDHGLLFVNHEYTTSELMFPNYDSENKTQQQADIEMAATGVSVVEIQRGADGQWAVNRESSFNRRITVNTPFVLTGPAAGHELLKTSADANGANVIGLLNQCAAGKTPWGTVVTSEENFQGYFGNLLALADDDPRKAMHERYGVPEEGSEAGWEKYYSRFDLASEPNESFRFGWMIEVDPYDPSSTPRKLTALGRFRHEGVTIAIAPSGQVAAYSGDDARFEYIYKFVSQGTYNAGDRQASMNLLNEGTLYVAKFNDDGTGEWLPLVHGQDPLTEANGFASQAEVLIRTREAADALGATRMDRPEDIDANPVNGKLYVCLTNNTRRGTEGQVGVDAMNPRPENKYGHIIELTETDNNYAGTSFAWEIFMLCGDPSDESTYFAGYPKDKVSAIANPDNLTFDLDGNLWISTDGQTGTLEFNDSIYAVPVEGPERGHLQRFFNAVAGAEMCGPEFTPDNTSFFTAIQHPGEAYNDEVVSTYEQPISVWPDGTTPPRPSVVVIQAESGGRVGQVAALAAAPSQAGASDAAPEALPVAGEASMIPTAISGPLVATLGLATAAAGVILRRRMRLQGKAEENS